MGSATIVKAGAKKYPLSIYLMFGEQRIEKINWLHFPIHKSGFTLNVSMVIRMFVLLCEQGHGRSGEIRHNNTTVLPQSAGQFTSIFSTCSVFHRGTNHSGLCSKMQSI